MKQAITMMILNLTATLAIAKGSRQENLLSISQGISSPSMTSTVNYSNGFTRENPVGVAYQTAARLSLQYDSGDNDASEKDDGHGGEFGIGNGRLGLAVGYYARNCDDCEGDTAGSMGFIWGGSGLGVRVTEDSYTVGFIAGAKGRHRLGLAADLYETEDDEDNVISYGVGYSYVESKFTFSVDASKLDYEDEAIDDDLIILTPGIAIRFHMAALSASYDMYINQDGDTDDSNENDLWFGFGVGGSRDWHLAVYGDYVNEWSLSGSLFF